MTTNISDGLKDEFERIFDLSVTEPMPIWAMALKVSEESGELSQAVNYHLGYLQHKVMKEPLVGEVADVINTALCVYVKAYPEKSKDELLKMLIKHLSIKSDKWEETMNRTIK